MKQNKTQLICLFIHLFTCYLYAILFYFIFNAIDKLKPVLHLVTYKCTNIVF